MRMDENTPVVRVRWTVDANRQHRVPFTGVVLEGVEVLEVAAGRSGLYDLPAERARINGDWRP